MSVILTPDHHSVSSAADAHEICYPFFKQTGITAFVYARIFDHGETYGLNTNPQWQLQHFNGGHLVTPPIPQEIINHKFSFILSLQTTPPAFLKTIQIFREVLNMDYPYFNIERYQGYYDLYVFCTTVNNADIINFYLNQSSYIEKFKHYFKDKAKNLIKEASRHKIVIPTTMQPQIDWTPPGKAYIELNPKQYTFHHNHREISFTHREAQCLKYLSTGHTIKSTAKLMAVSPRTIESHLTNIKFKTQTTTKSALLILFNSLGTHIP